MFSLLGGPALSQFRLDKLLAELRLLDSRVTAIASRFIHFVACRASPNEQEMARLARLLRYGPTPAAAAAPRPRIGAPQELTVTPRAGTVSPWSSKATDIAQVCGLGFVERLERGTAYSLDVAAPLGAGDLQRLAAIFHDRMTESIWFEEPDLAALFGAAAPRPLRIVSLGADGRAALERANRDWGLALSGDEIDYLLAAFGQLRRDPTDAELMMFTRPIPSTAATKFSMPNSRSTAPRCPGRCST